MYEEQLIKEALHLPTNAIEYHVSHALAVRFPSKTLVQGGDGLFNIEEYAAQQLCTIEHRAVIYNQIETSWRGQEMEQPGPLKGRRLSEFLQRGGDSGPFSHETDEIGEHAKNAWVEVKWRDQTFDVMLMNWSEQYGRHYHYWIIAENAEIAKDFISAVCRWNLEVRGEVLVYSSGCWHKDARLFQAIKGSTFHNLILRGSLKEEIHSDLKRFFASRETYEMYGIPWKRGILFIGPPGNGKTHTVKAIINAMDQPCLYVKSFRDEYHTDEDNIRAVFDRARKSAPCILVLEDLDSLLNAQNRAFFLNELDGFAANVGVVTLATTNHPERLDPAILDRPSRFDRKYPFDLPETPERIAYINLWNASLQPALQLTEEQAAKLGELTEGFSFAYLKELFLSSMMRWIDSQQQDSMEQVMSGQATVLREQMISAQNQLTLEADPDSEQQEKLQQMSRMLPRRVVYRNM